MAKPAGMGRSAALWPHVALILRRAHRVGCGALYAKVVVVVGISDLAPFHVGDVPPPRRVRDETASASFERRGLGEPARCAET